MMGKDYTASASEEAKCPVDPKTREIWVQQARGTAGAEYGTTSSGHCAHNNQSTQQAQQPQHQPAPSPRFSWSSWSSWPSWSPSSWSIPFWSSQQPSGTPQPPPPSSSPIPANTLDTHRVISSIPRSSHPGPSACPSSSTSSPANNEFESGTSASGNWIYPSEKMFFEAMRRKGHSSANVTDMKTVVPIHNAVNERAWQDILAWEAPYNEMEHGRAEETGMRGKSRGKCGGPRLHSFEGFSSKMTPRARINSLLGYTAPFDRHDWVVDRCGTRIEYVIDFYAGRPGQGDVGKINFYLDVRPKLNTWEGVKMRILKGAGLV